MGAIRPASSWRLISGRVLISERGAVIRSMSTRKSSRCGSQTRAPWPGRTYLHQAVRGRNIRALLRVTDPRSVFKWDTT